MPVRPSRTQSLSRLFLGLIGLRLRHLRFPNAPHPKDVSQYRSNEVSWWVRPRALGFATAIVATAPDSFGLVSVRHE
jgi:hypothetical protein